MFFWEAMDLRSEDRRFGERIPLMLGVWLRNGFLDSTVYREGGFYCEIV